METFRCPTCLFVLTDPEQGRCPSCHKRLRRRGRPIVLGARTQPAAVEPPTVDVVYAVLAEDTEPVTASLLIPKPVAPAYEVPRAAVDEAAVDTPIVDDAPVLDDTSDDVAPVIQLPVAPEREPVGHTTIFAPSQFDPEMRQVLDDLYRKARAEVDEDEENRSA